MQLLEDFVRWILWVFNGACFWLSDNVFKILKEVSTLDFVNIGDGVVLIWWRGFMQFLVIAVVIRLLYVLINDVIQSKANLSNILKNLIKVCVIIFIVNFMPFFMKGVANASELLISNMNYIIGIPNDILPSTIIISAGNAAQNDTASSGYWTDNEFVDGGIKHITYDDVESVGINAGDGVLSDIPVLGGAADFTAGIIGAKNYRFFPDTLYLFLTLFIAFYSCFLFVIVALDIAKRWFELVSLILVSFIPISSMIQDGKEMIMWFKMYANIYLSNYLEFFLVLASIYLMLVADDAGLFVQMVILFSGLLFTLNGSQKVSQLLGIETSGNTLQDLANLSLVGRGLSSVVGGVTGAVRNVVGAGTRTGYYIAGGVGSLDYGLQQSSISSSQLLEGGNINQNSQANTNMANNSVGGGSFKSDSSNVSNERMNARNNMMESQNIASSASMNDFSTNGINDVLGKGDGSSQMNSSESLSSSNQVHDTTNLHSDNVNKTADIGSDTQARQSDFRPNSNTQNNRVANNYNANQNSYNPNNRQVQRTDTISTNRLWKPNSLMDRGQSAMRRYAYDTAMNNSSFVRRGLSAAGSYAFKRMDRSYENALRAKQNKISSKAR